MAAYTFSNQHALSCAPAPLADSTHWLRCYRTMWRILDACEVRRV